MKNIICSLLLVLTFLFSYVTCEDLYADDSSGIQSVTFSSGGNTPHPPGLPSNWKGRNVSELVEVLGEPDILLDTAVRGIVIYGDTPSVMYVYVPGNGTGGTCYAAYVVEHDSGEILGYHCR